MIPPSPSVAAAHPLLSTFFSSLQVLSRDEESMPSSPSKSKEKKGKKKKSRSSYKGTMRSWNGTGVRFRCRGMTRGSPESKNQRRGSERERERERVRGGRGEKKTRDPCSNYSSARQRMVLRGATRSVEERGGATTLLSSPT